MSSFRLARWPLFTAAAFVILAVAAWIALPQVDPTMQVAGISLATNYDLISLALAGAAVIFAALSFLLRRPATQQAALTAAPSRLALGATVPVPGAVFDAPATVGFADADVTVDEVPAVAMTREQKKFARRAQKDASRAAKQAAKADRRGQAAEDVEVDELSQVRAAEWIDTIHSANDATPQDETTDASVHVLDDAPDWVSAVYDDPNFQVPFSGPAAIEASTNELLDDEPVIVHDIAVAEDDIVDETADDLVEEELSAEAEEDAREEELGDEIEEELHLEDDLDATDADNVDGLDDDIAEDDELDDIAEVPLTDEGPLPAEIVSAVAATTITKPRRRWFGRKSAPTELPPEALAAMRELPAIAMELVDLRVENGRLLDALMAIQGEQSALRAAINKLVGVELDAETEAEVEAEEVETEVEAEAETETEVEAEIEADAETEVEAEAEAEDLADDVN